MAIRSINNSFTRGEVDPTLLARDDLDIFNKAARKLRNMISLWTGAATLAPGTKYIDVMVDREDSNAVIQDSAYIKGFDFLYSVDDDTIFTIIIRKSQTNIALDIYINDALSTTLKVADFAVLGNYGYAQIPDIHIALARDRFLLLHESVSTNQVVYNGTSWNVKAFSPRKPATFDYSTLGLPIDYTGFTFNLSATSGSAQTVTEAGANQAFTANHVNGIFQGITGIARITAVNTAGTEATIDILTAFTSTAQLGKNVSIREAMFNSGGGTPTGTSRGYPSRGFFYNDRLILARSSSLNNIAVFSEAKILDNFDDTTIDASSSFSITLNSKGNHAIQSIIGDDTLVFITSNKIFAQSPLVEAPINGLNVYLAPQSQAPASDIEAVTIDNQTLFVHYDKTEVTQALYNINTGKYGVNPATIYSGHLVDVINSNASWEPSNIDTKLYMATQENGSMLMFSTLQNNGVAGWSLRTTQGLFKQVIGDGKQSHVIVSREINIGSSYAETLDYAFLSDSTFKARYEVTEYFDSATGTSTVSVLESDDDYIIMGNQVAFTGLDIDLSTVASDDCGLTFEYLDDNGFWNVFSVTDGTSGFTQDGEITWAFSDVGNWEAVTFNNIESKFWIRIRRTTASVSTIPIMGHVEINTDTRLYLERQDFDYYTDSSIAASSDSSGDVTGLDHLAGQRVWVRKDDASIQSVFVDDSGNTNVKAVSSTLEFGIWYKPKLVPMPIYAPTQLGDSLYAQMYVQDLYVDYVDSLYLVAGFEPQLTNIPNMKLGDYTLGSSVPPQTGVYRLSPRGDWSSRQEFVITQSAPGQMTIIGVGYNVEIS